MSFLGSCSLFLGCAKVGPDYEKSPEINLPDSWTLAIQKDNSAPFSGAQRWWQKFDDRTLDRLIRMSRQANPNIQIARARITESWHQRSVLAAAWYPHSDFNARDDRGLASFDRSGVKWDANASHGQLAQLDVGWELDLFGKIKRQVEAAQAEYEAKIDGWRDVIVFINSEVALHYIAYRTLEKRIENAEEARLIFQKTKNMIQLLKEQGIASQLDLHEANGRLKTTESDLPRLTQQKVVVRNRLAALLAIQPSHMERLLQKNREIPTPPSSIATGFPSQMLRSRPDVRRAERKVAAQTARIGIATAALYPELSISGAITYEYLRQGITVETLTRTIGLGPSLKWRIFHGCADRARIKEQHAKLNQEISTYHSTVIHAVTQVENSMARLYFTKQRLALLRQSVESHQKAAELMEDAYQLGEVDLRRLLNAQRDFISHRDEMFATQGRRAAHSVRLFKALGGGELPPPKPQARKESKAKETASSR